MATLDEIFKREFNQTRSYLKSGISIYDLVLQPTTLPKQDFYNVKGIDDKYYGRLNDYNVSPLPRGYELKRRQLNSNGEFRVRKDGSFFIVNVSVPRGSVAVLSHLAIGLPFSYKVGGFDYVDYIEVKNDSGEVTSRRYIYILPRKYLYKTNFNALAISSKKMKAYQGISIKTWNCGVLYLCVIPYKPNRTYASTIVLTAKVGTNFSNEISSLIGTLYNKGVISNPADYITSEGENVAIDDVDPAYNFMEYAPIDAVSLGSLSEKDLDEVLGV